MVTLLLGFGPTLLIVGLFVLLARRATAGGGMGALGNFGRSRARRVDPQTIRVTFDDVAGIDEAKAELSEIVDFLRNPGRYSRLGGRMPHGALLYGPPGTGKTLLARAVAGEAHAAFFSISAAEFIEAIVGVGASRVRDLFSQAKEAAPSIIFIDEIDAIGRSRQGSASITGANDEREQTLDQILTELDGFEPAEAVVVLAASNRPDILDPALLRAGRFDRRVAVQPPDRAGRAKILKVHTRSMPLADDVDLDALAATTPGMVGADLANLANEGALLAAKRDHDKVEMRDFTDSLEKLLLGSPRGILLSSADRERTAYHESGHALVGMLTPEADPVRKVSIIPRGMALGVTLSTPDADRVSYSLEELEAKIKVSLGGRAAEEVVYGTITTGAESDIEQLTQIARQMVGKWGMSDAIGPVAVISQDGQGPLLPGVSETSEHTQELVDSETQRIVAAAHAEVTRLLGRAPRAARVARARPAGRRDARRARRLCRGGGAAAAARGRRRGRAGGARPGLSRRREFGADEHLHADRADREADQRRRDDRRRRRVAEHVGREAERGDGRGHAELRAGRERTRSGRPHQPRRSQPDRDVEDREGGGEGQHRRFPEQRADVQARPRAPRSRAGRRSRRRRLAPAWRAVSGRRGSRPRRPPRTRR